MLCHYVLPEGCIITILCDLSSITYHIERLFQFHTQMSRLEYIKCHCYENPNLKSSQLVLYEQEE